MQIVLFFSSSSTQQQLHFWPTVSPNHQKRPYPFMSEAPYEDACHVLNAVLRTATGIEAGPPAWAIWPEVSNRGHPLCCM